MRMTSPLVKLILLSFLNLSTLLSIAEPLHVGGFNINSTVASSTKISKQMAEHQDIGIWGLSEATNDWTRKIINSLNENNDRDFRVIKGSTGKDKNYLQIYYDFKKYHLISHIELDEINKEKRVRAPLVAKFKNKNTNQEFLFMVNHLYRKNSDARLAQSKQLNKWIQKQSLPVIAVGDYNFDMSPHDTSKRDPGYDAITKNDTVTWIQPEVLLPSQCSSYNSILDFIFISDKVIYTSADSKISYPEAEYCTTSKNSDHRPVTAMIDIY